MKKVTKAIIPAAGFGTRFLPITKSIPKEMLPIINKPAIQYIVEEIVKSGIKDILIITSSYKNSIIDYFDYQYELEQNLISKNRNDIFNEIRNISNMANICFMRQKEPLGLGDAILKSKWFVKEEPFAVLLGDDITYSDNGKIVLKQCINLFNKCNKNIVCVRNVNNNDVKKYGIIKYDNSCIYKNVLNVIDMIEKPNIFDKPSNYAIFGRYILTSDIFFELEKERNYLEEMQLTPSLKRLSNKGLVYAKIIDSKKCYDIGNKIDYLKACIDFSLKNQELKNKIKNYIKNKYFK